MYRLGENLLGFSVRISILHRFHDGIFRGLRSRVHRHGYKVSLAARWVLVLSTASLTAVFLTSSDACTITLLSVCSATPSSEATASEGVPAFVIYLGVVLGVLGLIGAAGLWMLKRWALWLTIVVCVLNILSAAPGLAFAPTPTLRALATVGVVGFALVILLVVLPNSRRAYT